MTKLIFEQLLNYFRIAASVGMKARFALNNMVKITVLIHWGSRRVNITRGFPEK